MRKFKLLALALVLGSASLFATNVEYIEDVPSNVIRNQIVELLGVPDFVIEDDMNVAISFTFNSEAEIVVLSVDSRNKDVLNYVRKNINGKVIDMPGERDKIYSFPLTIAVK